MNVGSNLNISKYNNQLVIINHIDHSIIRSVEQHGNHSSIVAMKKA